MTVNIPQGLVVWAFPVVLMIMFSVFAVAFIKIIRSAKNDCDIGAAVGCAICGVVIGGMMLTMYWHLFAKSLALPGY